MKTLTSLFLLLLSLNLSAQVTTKFLEPGDISEKGIFQTGKIKNVEQISVNMREVWKAHEKYEEASDFAKFGTSVDVYYTLNNSGSWAEIGNGRIWKMQLRSPGALSINMVFGKLSIPEQGRLYIYNEDRSMQYGPITSKDMTERGKFATDLLAGESIILELLEPNSVRGGSVLELTSIIHGYNNPPIFGFGESLDCNVDINCPDGLAWQNQSNGVGMVIFGMYELYTTGALLNNGCEDFIPFFLSTFRAADIGVTPFGCEEEEAGNGSLSSEEIENVEEWMFRFQYKSPTCDGSEPTPEEYITFQNCHFRAGVANTSSILVELAQQPTAGMKFLGWDSSGDIPQSGAMIGHPMGDVMKISTYNSSATTNPNPLPFLLGCDPLEFPAESMWHMDIETGAHEVNFVGSPVFNQLGRVIGQNVNGLPRCAPTFNTQGRFDVAWEGHDQNDDGTVGNDEKFEFWLRGNSNAFNTDILSIPFITPPDGPLCENTPITICVEDLSVKNYSIIWESSGNLNIINTQRNCVTVEFNGNDNGVGVAGLTASIIPNTPGSCIPINNLTVEILVGPLLASQMLLTGEDEVCSGDFYTYAATFPGGHQPGYTYEWDFPNNWASDGQFENKILLTTPTGETPDAGFVRVRVNNGCGFSEWIELEVSPNKGCTESSRRTTTDPKSSLLFYPNPASQALTIELPENVVKSGAYTIELYDHFGELVRVKSETKPIDTFRTLDLEEGIYILKVIYRDGVLSKKVVIDHK